VRSKQHTLGCQSRQGGDRDAARAEARIQGRVYGEAGQADVPSAEEGGRVVAGHHDPIVRLDSDRGGCRAAQGTEGYVAGAPSEGAIQAPVAVVAHDRRPSPHRRPRTELRLDDDLAGILVEGGGASVEVQVHAVTEVARDADP